MNSERKYIAISIKHTPDKWKFGDPCVLWGWHQTRDDEKRCFGGYTKYLSKAERYSIDEFISLYGSDIMNPEPVNMCVGFRKKYKKYDSVLVPVDNYAAYCTVACLPIAPQEKE